MTADGRFATEIEIDGELLSTIGERHQVHHQICRCVTVMGHCEKGNPNDVKLERA